MMRAVNRAHIITTVKMMTNIETPIAGPALFALGSRPGTGGFGRWSAMVQMDNAQTFGGQQREDVREG